MRYRILAVAAALALAACSTSKEEGSSTTAPAAAPTTTASAPETTAAPVATAAVPDTTPAAADTTAPPATDPATTEAPATDPPVATFAPVVDANAPGVTADTVKIGIAYLDLSLVKALLDNDPGDWKAAYQAYIDEVNDAGGINGRKIEPVFMPITPQSPDDTPAIACAALTKDDPVFAVVGSYTDGADACIVESGTPMIGGWPDFNTIKKAKNLWFTTEKFTSELTPAAAAILDSGAAKGKVAIVSTVGDEANVEAAKKAIEAAGGEVADTFLLDILAGVNDPNLLYDAAETASLKFQSEGVEKLWLIGSTAQQMTIGLSRTDYRPQLLMPELSALQLVQQNEEAQPVLDNAISAGVDDTSNSFLTLGGKTAACVKSQQTRLKVTLVHDKDKPKDKPNFATSSIGACRLMDLLTAVLTKAGPELNWGTFTTAGQNLGKVELTGSQYPWNFTKDTTDGAPPAFLYTWDPASKSIVPKS